MAVPTMKLMSSYYAATVVFLLLDYLFDINIRLAFLQPYPGWRAAYYAMCIVLFFLTVKIPRWGTVIGITESLLTLSMLIISMAMRVLIVTDEMITEGRGYPTLSEIANFLRSPIRGPLDPRLRGNDGDEQAGRSSHSLHDWYRAQAMPCAILFP